ncbi:hypothetical protein L1887_47042 [Cichorium endivia]|nr:hypothetical protein L1887_47042 [Cichorium endivia]
MRFESGQGTAQCVPWLASRTAARPQRWLPTRLSVCAEAVGGVAARRPAKWQCVHTHTYTHTHTHAAAHTLTQTHTRSDAFRVLILPDAFFLTPSFAAAAALLRSHTCSRASTARQGYSFLYFIAVPFCEYAVAFLLAVCFDLLARFAPSPPSTTRPQGPGHPNSAALAAASRSFAILAHTAMHDENALPAANAFASNGYPPSAPSNSTPPAPGFALDPLQMMKRAPSQSHDAHAGLGHLGAIPNPQMPDAAAAAAAAAAAKKARFVSEGNIPSLAQHNFANFPTAAAAQPPFLTNGATTGPQPQPQPFSAVPGLQPPGNGTNGTRSFSGNLGHANLIGAQNGQPFDAAAAAAAVAAAPFLLSGANGLNPAATMFPNFGANFGATPGFVPNVGVLSAMPRQINPLNRTVYVGNLPADASVDELLNLVKFGPIENVRILPEKNCAFISFLDGSTATAFHADACVKKVSLHNQELKIGWGKPSQCHPAVLMAVQQNQASRNVYVGQLDESVSEQSLRDDLSRFGPIDQVKIVRDKNIGFRPLSLDPDGDQGGGYAAHRAGVGGQARVVRQGPMRLRAQEPAAEPGAQQPGGGHGTGGGSLARIPGGGVCGGQQLWWPAARARERGERA